jgi:hypothetical protein
VAFDPDWKERFHLTLSFADGSPARTYAIQSGLRPYRPTYVRAKPRERSEARTKRVLLLRRKRASAGIGGGVSEASAKEMLVCNRSAGC